MTLEQVMALDGRQLDAAVAGRIEWIGEPWKFSPIDGMPFDHPFPAPAPEFHKSWSAAMRIRDWARGLDEHSRAMFVVALLTVIQHRTGIRYANDDWALDAECPDYCRAALLVS